SATPPRTSPRSSAAAATPRTSASPTWPPSPTPPTPTPSRSATWPRPSTPPSTSTDQIFLTRVRATPDRSSRETPGRGPASLALALPCPPCQDHPTRAHLHLHKHAKPEAPTAQSQADHRPSTVPAAPAPQCRDV